MVRSGTLDHCNLSAAYSAARQSASCSKGGSNVHVERKCWQRDDTVNFARATSDWQNSLRVHRQVLANGIDAFVSLICIRRHLCR
jgi:hypothetical protein